MRVLYVSPYAPARDGIGDYTAQLAGEVRARGHSVGVVSARGGTPGPEEVIARLPRSRAGREALLERIRGWRPDVIHVQFAVASYATATPALARLLGSLRALGVPVLVTFHEVTRDTDLLRAPGRALYRLLARRADIVIVHTAAALRALLGPVGARPRAAEVVAHLPRAPAAATAAAQELRSRHGLQQTRVLLSFGFIHVDKGLGDLIEAFSLLRRGAGEQVADVRLVVAGDVRARTGAFRVFALRDRLHLARVRARIRRLGLAPQIVFTGYVPEGEVRPWLELAVAAVLPYRRIEQSGVASLAAAIGCPVLASDAGELRGEPRWRFPARDPRRLGEVLKAFLAGGERAARDDGTPTLGSAVDSTVALYASLCQPAEAVLDA